MHNFERYQAPKEGRLQQEQPFDEYAHYTTGVQERPVNHSDTEFQIVASTGERQPPLVYEAPSRPAAFYFRAKGCSNIAQI